MSSERQGATWAPDRVLKWLVPPLAHGADRAEPVMLRGGPVFWAVQPSAEQIQEAGLSARQRRWPDGVPDPSVYVWTLASDAAPLVARHLFWVGTGDGVPRGAQHVASAQGYDVMGRPFVVHVFERGL